LRIAIPWQRRRNAWKHCRRAEQLPSLIEPHVQSPRYEHPELTLVPFIAVQHWHLSYLIAEQNLLSLGRASGPNFGEDRAQGCNRRPSCRVGARVPFISSCIEGHAGCKTLLREFCSQFKGADFHGRPVIGHHKYTWRGHCLRNKPVGSKPRPGEGVGYSVLSASLAA